MNVQRTTLAVDGMTCGSCESRVAGSLRAVPGVISAEANLRGGTVVIEYDGGEADPLAFRRAIEEAGYTVGRVRPAGTAAALGIGLVLVAAYSLAGYAGAFDAIPRMDATLGYSMLFVVGLLTSIHCVAMCGGIALSMSVAGLGGQARPAGRSGFGDLAPGLAYNAGRVVSYTVIGGIVGAVGSAFGFSSALKGAIAGIAGAFMVFFGLGMLGVVAPMPGLPGLVPRRLRGVGARLKTALGGRGPFVVGLLNGLMPCGPLQTMQVYALGTGSAVAGALSMFVFSLGTVPLMLAFGATAALLPRRLVPLMIRASAVLVMFLGLVTVGRAAAIAGFAVPQLGSIGSPDRYVLESGIASPRVVTAGPSGSAARMPVATVSGGVQEVLTEFRDGRYVPFVATAGVPLRWTIRIKADDITGCNNELIVPAYGIRKPLLPGDNLIEFTPAAAGTIGYSCWMGMIRSRIVVVAAGG